MSHILIVEDETIIRTALRRLLERNRYSVSEAGAVSEALEKYNLNNFDLIISDLRLPGAPGTDLIEKAGRTPVLIMTSYASVKSAVDAMRMGAADYISKPFDHEEMVLTVKRILDTGAIRRQNVALKQDINRSYPVRGMLGSSPPMKEVFQRIQKVAPTDTTVLILGESGTGKELVARAVHEQSNRRNAPMITVNCAAIPEALIESELFGHEKGAFSGAAHTHRGLVEAADGGTLFLDEIGELPMEAQARLLRVLQEGEIRRLGSVDSRRVSIRLIAATHQDLDALVLENNFREDLYFRLNVMQIQLAPLRRRGKDVEELADSLLEKTCQRLNRPTMQFAADATESIRKYAWPGNVRELENAIERAVILSEGDILTEDLLAIDSEKRHPMDSGPPADMSLEDYFQTFVLEHQDTMTETELAKRLGISRKSLWERRQRLGIPRHKKKKPVAAEEEA
ncbi:sigma-54-dependent transcriptional regulator [Pelagibaculum spongiae]|uniref:Response regulator n=1 Tax=Pelagibaculum spongiae TaxID=2080658 RepID=A0A2V1H6C2_9GAMM|nr:sigma-54 dependent transcriptional regulator [Pelagibaculum spongiae]PVZ72305.1 response regulator [Pelagibaculum spongiae]